MSAITKIFAREVLDSRGRPTVEVDVHAEDDAFGRAIVPSGASTGTAEALELRDEDAERYDGRGVALAVSNVNDVIGPQLVGQDVTRQTNIDERLMLIDGTPQKRKMGANALLGVSLATARAGACASEMPLYEYFHHLRKELGGNDEEYSALVMPLPMTNMISGGLHAGGNIDFQDFLIMPIGAPDYRTALEWTVRIYNRLGELLIRDGFEGRLVGDEGGFGPRLESNGKAAEYVVRAIEAAKLRPGEDVSLALDVAATHFYNGSTYRLAAENNLELTSSQMVFLLDTMVAEYPIASIEDGLAEEDWAGWQELTERLGSRVQIVGDDLFATNSSRVRKGIKYRAANSVLIKMNQIGTITETLITMQHAREAGFTCVVSARSGETEDSSIADLAVGTGAEQIKIGSIVRGERLAKYNQLLRIEEEIGVGSRRW